MNLLQLTAIRFPARCPEDRKRPIHIRSFHIGTYLIKTLLTVDVQTDSSGGGWVPDGFGGAAWHASVAICDVSLISRSRVGLSVQPAIAVDAWSKSEMELAAGHLMLCFRDVGGLEPEKWYQGFHDLSIWRPLVGHERDHIADLVPPRPHPLRPFDFPRLV